MCQLEFTVEPCANAEHMSPGGHMTKLPVLQSGAFVVSELEPIIHLVEKKGVSLTHFLDADEKNDLRAYLCLTEKIFTCAEVRSIDGWLRTRLNTIISCCFVWQLYVSWIDSQTLNETTYKRYGSVYPWPLNHLQSWRKRRHVVNKLKLFGWAKYTNEQVLKKVEKCCITLTEKLGKNLYFYGDRWVAVDANKLCVWPFFTPTDSLTLKVNLLLQPNRIGCPCVWPYLHHSNNATSKFRSAAINQK